MSKTLSSVLFASALCCAASAANAQVTYFMQVQDNAGKVLIPGESEDPRHPNWVDIDFFSLGMSIPVGSGGGGGTVGKVTFSDFAWLQTIDRSVPRMFMHLAMGEVLPRVEMHAQAPGALREENFFQLQFDNVLLKKLDFTGSTGSDPVVSGALTFERITMTYIRLRPDGTWVINNPFIATWDLSTNSPGAVPTFSGSPRALQGLAHAMAGTVPVAAVPEPRTWALMGLGLVGVAAWTRRAHRAGAARAAPRPVHP